MPFGGHFDGNYKNIFEPGVKKAGLNPLRADLLLGPRPIVEDIFAQTKSAFMVLADLTTRNPNVLYEVGLAHALGKPVCLVIDKVEMENEKGLPFDLLHLRVISYDKNLGNWGEVLRKSITESLQTILRDPDSATPFRKQQYSMSLAEQDRLDFLDPKKIEKLDKLLDTPEFSYLMLAVGPQHGRTLIGYLAIGDHLRAADFLRGFGFPEIKRNLLLQVSEMALKYLSSLPSGQVPKQPTSKEDKSQRTSLSFKK